eukprot:c26545_g1_i1 orf=124-1797(-)
MLNFVALGLLLSSVGVAVIWTPQTATLVRRGEQSEGKACPEGIECFKATGRQTDEAIQDAASKAYDIGEGDKIAESKGAVFQKVGDAGQYAADRIKSNSEEFYSSVNDKVWQTTDALTNAKDSLKHKYDEAKKGVQEKVRESGASYMPNLGKGADWLSREDVKGGNLYPPCMEDRNAKMSSREHDYDKVRNCLQEAQEAIYHAATKVAEAVGLSHVGGSESKRFHDKDDNSYKGESETNTETYQGYKEKVADMNDKTKEKLFDTAGEKPSDDDQGTLSRKVHEFCQWFSQEAYDPAVDFSEGFGEPLNAAFQSASDIAEGNLGRDDDSEATLKHRDRSWKMAEEEAAQGVRGIQNVLKEQAGEVMKRVQNSKFDLKKVAGLCYAVLPLLYLFSFSLVYGTYMWVTFISGHLLACILPGQQLGLVQSKILPVYLRMLASGIAVCFLLHGLVHPWGSAEPSERGQYWSLLVSLSSALINTSILEPRATKVMLEKLKAEKEQGRGQSEEVIGLDGTSREHISIVHKKLKTIHGYSSFLNLVTLGGLTWHLLYLSNCLHLA